jgi:hypothetical protein
MFFYSRIYDQGAASHRGGFDRKLVEDLFRF